MQRKEDKYFTKHQKQGGVKLITSVDYNCPHCGRNVNFYLGWSLPQNHYCLSTKARCSGCGQESKFIYIDYDLADKDGLGKLFIHPNSKRRRSIIDFSKTDSTLNHGLQTAYESALNVYNVGEWTATSVLCRRLLEGITQDLLPDENKKLNLNKKLMELPKYLDLQKPILTLADALRKGGNLGAHFDLEKTPDKKIASQMLDLLDYLIEYIYILPNRIEGLHNEIEELNNK